MDVSKELQVSEDNNKDLFFKLNGPSSIGYNIKVANQDPCDVYLFKEEEYNSWKETRTSPNYIPDASKIDVEAAVLQYVLR
jgi:hypothetical protein